MPSKRLVTILGANGVGKSTIGKKLHEVIENSAYIDMEYCCYLNLAQQTEGIALFTEKNIYALISSCMEYAGVQTIIWPYGLHGTRKQIYENVMARLSARYVFESCPIVLECVTEENVARMRKDNRDDARIQRALAFSNVYHDVAFPRVDTTNRSVGEVVQRVLELLCTS